MVIDDVTIFLGKGAENFTEEEIRHCIDIEKSRHPQGSVKELFIRVERGWVQDHVLEKCKKFKIAL